MIEHRSSERGFYDQLQREENAEARRLLESLLDNSALTYDEICLACKVSALFGSLKDVTPQDLTRYRQRRAREEDRARTLSIIESDAEALLNAATGHPGGVVAKALRRMFAEHALARFDERIEDLDPVDLSRETARHALVEQRDRKLDIEEHKADLDRRRVNLAEAQADLQKDKLGIGVAALKFLLAWLVLNEPTTADVLTRRSDEIIPALEEHLLTEG